MIKKSNQFIKFIKFIKFITRVEFILAVRRDVDVDTAVVEIYAEIVVC